MAKEGTVFKGFDLKRAGAGTMLQATAKFGARGAGAAAKPPPKPPPHADRRRPITLHVASIYVWSTTTCVINANIDTMVAHNKTK